MFCGGIGSFFVFGIVICVTVLAEEEGAGGWEQREDFEEDADGPQMRLADTFLREPWPVRDRMYVEFLCGTRVFFSGS